MSTQTYEGRCHCGAIGFTLRTAQPPARWAVRACQCSFCRSHNARTTTDPSGSVTFRVSDASKLQRYRFGLRSADFLICRECGVYLGAVLTTGERQYSTVNINAIQPLPEVPDAVFAAYDNESLEHRNARREKRWTPVTPPI